MIIVYLGLSILLLIAANIFKILRLSQFIEPYEKPNSKRLIQALSIGNILNLVLPFRLGNLFRIYLPGKYMKNGISFSFATIIVEIFIDFIIVSLIYIMFFALGFDTLNNILFYLSFLIGTTALILLLTKLKPLIKKAILKVASIFNKSIELKILKLSWFTIISFENILKKVNKRKLLIYSVIVWSLNILSCYLLSFTLNGGNLYSCFDMFFSRSGITSNFLFLFKNIDYKIIFAYYILSAIILFLMSFVLKFKEKSQTYIELLPQSNVNDRLQFLELYFNNYSREYFNDYLKLNSDVAVLEDYSAGSNATTILCSKNDETFYRKYAFGKDADKLKKQIDWIHKYENKISLTKIIYEYYEDGICSYDMTFNPNAVTCFNYVHTNSFKESWSKIVSALEELEKLHNLEKSQKADKKTIEQYINDKVLKNIEKIEKCTPIKNILNYDYVYINGQKYHNLNYYKKYLNFNYLYKIFKNDLYTDIHGDFTIENIICLKDRNKTKQEIYLIDPNIGNIHNSPYLDYAKLFQSLHGGYEFLMNTKNVSFHNNQIEFFFTKSSTYNKLFDNLVDYLNTKFGQEGLKCIFFHEIIHWLRLMPYKIEKDSERAMLFYAGLLMVCQDIEKRFNL